MHPNFSFSIQARSLENQARLGLLRTPHGSIETPAFVFCATKGAIKALSPLEMQASGTQIILSNTYHLLLQPGPEVIAEFGGIHRFMGWPGPLLTDSGGFQIFSLGQGSVADEIKGRKKQASQKTLLKITEEGALFRSYLDGSLHLLSPERSIDIQRQIGADLVVVLDECTPFHVDKSYTQASMERSHRWAIRSLAEFQRRADGRQALYGIVQGGIYADLRQESCQFVNSQPFFGQAIGGSLGADKAQMQDIVSLACQQLDPDKPKHLLGIGGISDIFFGVSAGIDTFDCVHPTRLARHGGALVRPAQLPIGKKGDHLNLKNALFRLDQSPIEADCPCSTCQRYSRGYLHHLLKAREFLAYSLITLHNVAFMNRLMLAIRQAILHNTLEQEKKNWIA